MISFIKKLFGKKDEHVIKVNLDYDPNSTHTFKRAKKGSFDESLFINPKTGKFQFPKYKHKKDCLIKIKDCTNYKEDIWDDLEPEEKRSFDIRDFEFHFTTPDIEIDSFWDLFNKTTSEHLKPFTFLKSKGEELQEIVEEIEDMNKENDKFILADGDVTRQLYDSGCFNKYEFQDDNEMVEFNKYALDLLKVAELKSICKANNLKSAAAKQELINQLIENNISIELPMPIVPNNEFHDMMKNFHALYIEDIRKNIKNWHPLYVEEVWSLVSTDAENEDVEKIAKEISGSKYWEEYLYNESI